MAELQKLARFVHRTDYRSIEQYIIDQLKLKYGHNMAKIANAIGDGEKVWEEVDGGWYECWDVYNQIQWQEARK